MSLTPLLTRIHGAAPLGTVKLDGNKQLTTKAGYHTGVAWVKHGFNIKAMENDNAIKEQFRKELFGAYKNLSQSAKNMIEDAIRYMKPGPLTVRTAQKAIKMARNPSYFLALASKSNSIGTKLRLRLLMTFRPVILKFNLKVQVETVDPSLKGMKKDHKDHPIDRSLGSKRMTGWLKLADYRAEMQARALDAFRKVPDGSIPPTLSPTRKNNPEPGTLGEEARMLMGKLRPDQMVKQLNDDGSVLKENGIPQMRQPGSLTAAVNLPRLFWSSEPIMSVQQMQNLFTNPVVHTAIGSSTFLNSMREQVVPDNTTREKTDGAAELRLSLRKNLSPRQWAHLQERVGFLRELAALNLQKCGPATPSDTNKSPAEQLRTWQKAVCVSAANYFGLSLASPEKVLGLDQKESNILVSNAMVALVMHFEQIFEGKDPPLIEDHQPDNPPLNPQPEVRNVQINPERQPEGDEDDGIKLDLKPSNTPGLDKLFEEINKRGEGFK